MSIEDLTGDAIRDPDVLSLACRVHPHLSPELNELGTGVAKVEVQTRAGTHAKRIDVPKGHPDNPMSGEEFLEKFKDCARYAPRAVDEATIDRIVQMIASLEESENANQVIELLG